MLATHPQTAENSFVDTAAHRPAMPLFQFKAFRKSAVKRSIGQRLLELVELQALLEYVIVLSGIFLFCCTYGGLSYNSIHISFELPQKPAIENYSTTSSY